MVAGFTEVIEREETVVAAACNHPNWRLLTRQARHRSV